MKDRSISLYAANISKTSPFNRSRCRHTKDCYYRSRDGLSCDYLIKTGHSRGCSARNCIRYISRTDFKE